MSSSVGGATTVLRATTRWSSASSIRVPHGVRSAHVTYTQCEPTSGCAEPAALAAAPSSSAVHPGGASIASVACLRLAIAWCTRASSLATRGGNRAGSSTRTGSIVTEVTSSSQ